MGRRQVGRVAVPHRRLRAAPLAPGLHCTCLTPATLDDPDRSPFNWAHGGLRRRPVTRPELHDLGRVLHGEPSAGLLPPVSERQLRGFVVRDQRDVWRPAVEDERLWRRDFRVDLGLLTFAGATVTLPGPP